VKSSALNTQPFSKGMDADHTELLYHMKVRWLQARNEEGKGAQFPGRRVTMGAPNHCEGRRKVPTMSQAGADTGGCRECIPLTRPKEVLT